MRTRFLFIIFSLVLAPPFSLNAADDLKRQNEICRLVLKTLSNNPPSYGPRIKASPTDRHAQLSDPALLKLEELEKVYLEKLQEGYAASGKKDPKLFEEIGKLKALVERFQTLRGKTLDFQEIEDLLKGLTEVKDSEFADQIVLIKQIQHEAQEVKKLMREALLKNQPEHQGGVEIWINPGDRPKEFFNSDLATMYERWGARWIRSHGGIGTVTTTKVGNAVVIRIDGVGAYGALQFEAGTHYVFSERDGKTFTNTADISVVPIKKGGFDAKREAELKASIVVTTNKKASGPGGQKVNKTESAVTATLKLSDGTAITEERNDRKQSENREAAVEAVLKRAKEIELQIEKDALLAVIRSQKKGAAGVGAKIRTYDYRGQGHVVDERAKAEGAKPSTLDSVKNGKIDPILETVEDHYLENLLLEELRKKPK